MTGDRPWVTFCISTYRRPHFLEEQLNSLLQQTFQEFLVVISDNDPEKSGEAVIQKIKDSRIRYFANEENLGMIPSFNKSISRADTEFVVMVTDDDPVDVDLLEVMHNLYNESPGHSVYAGFTRANKTTGNKETIQAKDFIAEILDPVKTPWLLWSSCVLRRDDVIAIGGIPDYGSPHLADHALIAFTGSRKGGVIVNKRFSTLTSHDANFSKFNFVNYVNGCKGFYEVMNRFCIQNKLPADCITVVKKHLYHWFIANIFNLKRYYTVSVPDTAMLKQVEVFGEQIMSLEFMRPVNMKYRTKQFIFKIKKTAGLLKKK